MDDSARDVVVRPYVHEDRAAVRHICFQTGYMGEPADFMWRDRESWADMFSGYYTDVEPDSAFVVEIDGSVSGYLLGAVDWCAAPHPNDGSRDLLSLSSKRSDHDLGRQRHRSPSQRIGTWAKPSI